MTRRVARMRLVFALALLGASGAVGVAWPALHDDASSRGALAEQAATELGARLAAFEDLPGAGPEPVADTIHEWLQGRACRAEVTLHRPGLADVVVASNALPSQAAPRARVAIVQNGDVVGRLELACESIGASMGSTVGAGGWLPASRRLALAAGGVALALLLLLGGRPSRSRRGELEGGWSQAESRVTQTLDFLSTGVVILDRAGRIVFINRSLAKLLARPRRTLIGGSIDTLGLRCDRTAPAPGDPHQRDEGSASSWAAWPARLPGRARGQMPGSAAEGSSVGQRVSARSATGTDLAFQASLLPIRAGARVLGALVCLDDVTLLERQRSELAAARLAADRASQAKSAFLANMSHEIRTPINGVMGMLELLRSTPLQARQREFALAAEESASALLHLINDILDLSKIEAGKLELSPIPFRLEDCVGSALRVVCPAAAAKGLELVLRAQSVSGTRITADPERLRQVLINLVSNAIKFTASGHVEVLIEHQPAAPGIHKIRVGVTDTGIGIPLDKQASLFRSFTQVDASTSRKYGGTGLGLAICKQLVELMGGEIGIESAPGKGSTFHFVVTAPDGGTTESAGPAPSLAGRCFALEPSESPRRAVVEAGAAIGLDVVGVGSEAELIAQLDDDRNPAHETPRQPETPTLVILGGLRWEPALADLAARLKAAHPGLRLAALTLCDVRPEIELEQREVVDVWLRKPFTPNSLAASLAGAKGDETQEHGLVLEPARASRLSVLVAEDNPVGQVVAREFLAAIGIRATMVDRGDVAVELALAGRFDLILMDCHLPGIDGFAATRAIRQAQRRPGIPRATILALTARAMEGDKQKCLDAGMDGYLTKPIRKSVLAETISKTFHIPLVPGAHANRTAAPPPALSPSQPYRPAAIVTSEPPPAEPPMHPPNNAERAPHEPTLPMLLLASNPSVPAPALDLEPSQTPPLDTRSLLTRCMNNAGLAAELLSLFESTTQDDLLTLARAAAEARADAIEHAAHSIAGGALQVAAAPLAQIARSIERDADADGADIERRLDELRREFDRCVGFIHSALDGKLQSLVDAQPPVRAGRRPAPAHADQTTASS